MEEKVSNNLMEGLDIDLSDLDLGIEGITRTMSTIPVMKLTQAMTPEAQSRDFKDIYAGMFINDATKVPLGERVNIRVIRAWRCRVKFAPREAGGSVECSCPNYTPNDRGTDRGSEHGLCCRCMYNNFTDSDHCQIQYQMVVSVDDDPNDLYRIILSKTSYKASNKVNRIIQTMVSRTKLPMFCIPLVATVKQEKSKTGNSWYVWDFEQAEVKDNKYIDKALVAEYADVVRDITELRKAVIDDHNARVASASASQPANVAQEFTSESTSLAKELGITEAMNSEEIPF